MGNGLRNSYGKIENSWRKWRKGLQTNINVPYRLCQLLFRACLERRSLSVSVHTHTSAKGVALPRRVTYSGSACERFIIFYTWLVCQKHKYWRALWQHFAVASTTCCKCMHEWFFWFYCAITFPYLYTKFYSYLDIPLSSEVTFDSKDTALGLPRSFEMHAKHARNVELLMLTSQQCISDKHY